MAKKISFKTAYDTTDRICGYVVAEDKGEYYTISHGAYRNALKKRTVGGDAGIIFLADKPVYTVDNDIW